MAEPTTIAAAPTAGPVIARERPDRPDVRALVEASHAYSAALYPAESNHNLALDELLALSVTFLVARLDGDAVGCGALAEGEPDEAELKTMWVSPARRGHGIGRLLLERLEAVARERGCRWLRLETGIRQPEALALYRAAGFVETGPFGSYASDPLSVFMAKALAQNPRRT